MSADAPRETNIPKLQWRLVTDMRKASTCGRYVVDREPHHDNYPAVEYRYIAKRLDGQTVALGTFETFLLAADACERDLF